MSRRKEGGVNYVQEANVTAEESELPSSRNMEQGWWSIHALKIQGHARSVKVSFWKSNENCHANGRDDEGTTNCLEEDGILDLAESWLLDPNFTIENLADYVAFLVFGDPRFIFIAVVAAETVKWASLHLVSWRSVVVFGEELPRSEMAMVHAMKNLVMVSSSFIRVVGWGYLRRTCPSRRRSALLRQWRSQ